MTVRIARITVSVSDLSRSLDLYEGVLGLTRRFSAENLVMLATDDPALEVLVHERRPRPSDRGVAISFEVEDVDLSTASAIVAGATLVDEPSDQSWGERQSVLRDADGHLFCLISAPPDEAPELL
jgi:catechol 2,3-dioxygenase-like lactoylglutathione lyase family enzyme